MHVLRVTLLLEIAHLPLADTICLFKVAQMSSQYDKARRPKSIHQYCAKGSPTNTLKALWCICIFPLIPLKTSVFGFHQTSFLPVQALEFSELKTPLVYTFSLRYFSPPGIWAIISTFGGDFPVQVHREAEDKARQIDWGRFRKCSGDGGPKFQIAVPLVLVKHWRLDMP